MQLSRDHEEAQDLSRRDACSAIGGMVCRGRNRRAGERIVCERARPSLFPWRQDSCSTDPTAGELTNGSQQEQAGKADRGHRPDATARFLSNVQLCSGASFGHMF